MSYKRILLTYASLSFARSMRGCIMGWGSVRSVTGPANRYFHRRPPRQINEKDGIRFVVNL